MNEKLNLSKMRDLYALKNDGIDLSTTSNDVGKLWDSMLFQMFGHYDAPETNGVLGCVESIKEIDPNFPLLDLICFDYSFPNYEVQLMKLKMKIKIQEEKNIDRKWTSYEKLHMKAFIYRLEGYDDLAADYWTDHLVKYPKDIFGLLNLTSHYIVTGNCTEIANIYNISHKKMSPHDVFYPFILGYEAFGLEEKGQLKQAFNLANESLGIYSWNSWASHTVAHIYDSSNNSKDGIEFMNRTKNDWISGSKISFHNNWHVCLFYLNEGKINEAFEILDSEIIPVLNSQYSHLCMSDVIGLLLRIELENNNFKGDINLSERWFELSKSIGHIMESQTGIEFYDAFLSLAMLGCKKAEMLEQRLDTYNNYLSKLESKIFEAWEGDILVNNCQLSTKHISKHRTMIPLIKSLQFYMDGDYQAVVNILYPNRKNFRKLGGSHAQNDIFFQILASALFLAGGIENISRLKLLLLEVKDVNQYKPYYQRLEENILDFH